ncbi:hypothetical protein II9_02095 [Bacillus cereus MSX-D12]|nr:hypothetical protein II9_02095 [Bacillus cereus MSX-D12]
MISIFLIIRILQMKPANLCVINLLLYNYIYKLIKNKYLKRKLSIFEIVFLFYLL